MLDTELDNQLEAKTSPKKYMYFAAFGTCTITVRQLDIGLAEITRKMLVYPIGSLRNLTWTSPDHSMDQWVNMQDDCEFYSKVDETT
jgi:hypothetical protein